MARSPASAAAASPARRLPIAAARRFVLGCSAMPHPFPCRRRAGRCPSATARLHRRDETNIDSMCHAPGAPMRRLTKALLATTGLTALAFLPAHAGILFESTDSPGFGHELEVARLLASGDIAVGDINAYAGLPYDNRFATRDYFRLDGASGIARIYSLVFTASMAGALYEDAGNSSDSSAGTTLLGYYGLQQAAVTGSGSSHGPNPELLLQDLSIYQTTAVSFAGSSSATGSVLDSRITVTGFVAHVASSSDSAAAAPLWVANNLRPLLSFYDNDQRLLFSTRLNAGNSVTISANLLPDNALYLSVATPFDYTLSVSSVEAPEPAS
eukprot:gene8576-11622_t